MQKSISNNIQAVGGLYEVCIGVKSLSESAGYFARFGYRAGHTVDLSLAVAESLYGVSSSAKVMRLMHGNADHGLIRLIEWQDPVNKGLQQCSMRSVGSRWSNNQTLQISRIFGHARVAEAAGQNLHICAPEFAQFGHEGLQVRPFEEVLTGVCEMTLLTDLYRQCFFERVDYPSPLFGAIDKQCLFQTSQVTHCGVTTSLKDRSVFDFYDQCLGLKRVLDHDAPHEQLQASKTIFDLPEGLGVHALAFDEPASGEGELKRSGRFLVFNFDQDKTIETVHDRSRAGVLGYSHFSWRVRNIGDFRTKAIEYGAQDVGTVELDEFGSKTWACISPDGFYWIFLQADNENGLVRN